MKKLVLLLPLLLLGWSQPDQYRLISAPHGFIENCDLPMNGEWGFIECLATFTMQLFDFSDTKPGVDNLEAGLTINSTTVTPSFRYKGGDADGTTWTQWTYGSGLALQAGTAPSYNQGSPLLGTNDDSVKFNDGGNYEASNTDFGNIGSDDVAFEIVFKYSTTNASEYIIRKFGSATNYYAIYTQTSVGQLRFYGYDGANLGYTLVTNNTLENGVWYHAMVFVHTGETAENGCSIYINGVDVTKSPTGWSSVGDLDNGGNLSFGDSGFAGNLAYAAMWKQSNWHQAGASGPAEWATIAQERFLKLTGLYPQIAKGTATPTVNTRAYTAYLDKLESGVRKLYAVGSEWLRVVHRQDSNTDDIYGYLAESQATNLILSSQDFSNTDYWTLVDAGDTVDATAASAPDKSTTLNEITADATAGDHGVTQDVTLTAATHTLSAYCDGDNADYDWIYLDGGSGNTMYCDCNTPAVGTATGGDGYVEDWGGGIARCALVYTGAASVHSIQIMAAEADGDKDVTGGGVFYLWGAQVEAYDYMSSYIPTTTASATRLADQLQYKGDNGNLGGVGSDKKGTMQFNSLMADYNHTGTKYFMSLTDASDAGNNEITFRIGNSDTALMRVESGGSGNNINGTTDLADGVTKSIRGTWETDSGILYIDSTSEGTPLTSQIPPDDLDDIDIGMAVNSSAHFGGTISNIRIKKKPVAP